MKLSALYLDDNVAVPGWTRVAGGVSTGRDSSFNATDGWDIERVEPGVYRLMREGMPAPVCIEGYGASYVELPTPSVDAPPEPLVTHPWVEVKAKKQAKR